MTVSNVANTVDMGGDIVIASAIGLGADTSGQNLTTVPGIYVVNSASAPTFSAIKGSIALNMAGSGTANRMWVNNGTTNWIAFTTAT